MVKFLGQLNQSSFVGGIVFSNLFNETLPKKIIYKIRVRTRRDQLPVRKFDNYLDRDYRDFKQLLDNSQLFDTIDANRM